MKHYVKPTQEKQPSQIIIHVGTNNLPANKKLRRNSQRNFRIRKFNQNKQK